MTKFHKAYKYLFKSPTFYKPEHSGREAFFDKKVERMTKFHKLYKCVFKNPTFYKPERSGREAFFDKDVLKSPTFYAWVITSLSGLSVLVMSTPNVLQDIQPGIFKDFILIHGEELSIGLMSVGVLFFLFASQHNNKQAQK
jgi:hypothetical protein